MIGATGTRRLRGFDQAASLPGTRPSPSGELFGRLDTTLELSFGRDRSVPA